MSVSIVIPTVTGREGSLARCIEAYTRLTPGDIEIITVKDEETCGLAWEKGAAQTKVVRTGQGYIHLSADDLEPRGKWWEDSVKMVKLGYLPAPRIMKPGGEELESCGDTASPIEYPEGSPAPYTAIPLMSIRQWERVRPIPPIHYYTDNWVSFKGNLNGWPSLVCRRYLFWHHHEVAGRGAGMSEQERMAHDRAEYDRYVLEEMKHRVRAAEEG